MVRHLVSIGIPVVLVHCYRGWTDVELFRSEPYPTLLLSSSAFYDSTSYGAGGEAARALSTFQPTVIQADYLSILAGPALTASQHFGAALVAEMPYVPSRFFRDQRLGARDLREVNRLIGIVAAVADALLCWTPDDKAALEGELRIPPSRLYAARPPFDAGGAVAAYDGSKSVLFLGNLYFHQNATAVRHICSSILPAVRDSDPEVTLTVVGDCPSGLFSSDESRHLRILGYRPDLAPVWSTTAAALAPMSSSNGGLHTKILTALAAGVPVLGSESAVQGLPPMDGLFVCRSPREYRDALLRLVGNRALREGIGKLAAQSVHEHFDSFRSVESLQRMYIETLAREPTHKGVPATRVAQPPVELRETFRNRRFNEVPHPVSRELSLAWVQDETTTQQIR